MSELNKDLQDAILRAADESGIDQSDVEVSLDEIDSFGDKASILEMFDSIKQYNRMLKERITFVNPHLTKLIPFTRENLYLMCAYTGNGKSTIAANISYPLWQQGKKVLVIANEESKSDVLYRIACLHLGYNFNAWKKGQMPVPQQKECVNLFPEISKYVKVLDVVYKDGLTTKIEGVINALDAVQNADFSCCLIDYYQLIVNSVDDPSKGRYDVLNKLRIYLQRYIKKSNIPIVLFAQLHSMGKRSNVELDSRVKECPAILEAATVVVECIPNFDLKKTDFLIKKDRFGLQGTKIECGFENGKFVNYDEGFKNKVKQAEVDRLATAVEARQRENPYDAAIAEQHAKVDKLTGNTDEETSTEQGASTTSQVQPSTDNANTGRARSTTGT